MDLFSSVVNLLLHVVNIDCSSNEITQLEITKKYL